MENQNAKVKGKSKGLVLGIAGAVVVVVIAIVAVILYLSSMSYVAKVQDLKITKQEYLVFSKFNMSQFLADSSSSAEPDQYDWKTSVNGETAKDQVQKNTLDNIQEIKIQLVKAKEAGIKLDKTDLDKIDSDIDAEIKQSGSRAKAEESYKKQYGISLSEYKEIYKEMTLTQKYMVSEHGKVTVSDDEIQKYYDEKKTDFDKVTVTHILVTTLDANQAPVSEGKKAEAKKKAEELLAKVNAGEDINELALANSDDKPGVTENKGKYTFGKGEMVPEFEEWAYSHSKGETGIVETDYGYHVMMQQGREETQLADVKDTIKSSLQYEKFIKDFTEKMEAWKKESQYAIVKNEKALAKVDSTLYGTK